jgi:NAD(P) transhydrogenase subunit alpha
VIGNANDTIEEVIGVIAIAFGTINIVGGFLVTDRMLGMFRGRKPKEPASDAGSSAELSERSER